MNPLWKNNEQVKLQMFPLDIQGRELMAHSLTQAKKLQIIYFRCELCKTELHLKLSVAFRTSLQVIGIADWAMKFLFSFHLKQQYQKL